MAQETPESQGVKNRTTINLRHNGRVYIGMSVDDFRAFVWSLRFRAGATMAEPRPACSDEAYERLIGAIHAFNRKFPEIR